jgi:hypothetical protein
MTSTRIMSNSVTTIATDGTISIQIDNRPAPGQDYTETRTTLRGMRVSGAGVETIVRRRDQEAVARPPGDQRR